MLVLRGIFIFSLLFAAVAVYGLPALARNWRKQRLLTRPKWKFDDYLEKCCEREGLDRSVVVGFFEALAKDIDVDVNLLRPTDRFDNELSVVGFWGNEFPELETFLETIFDKILPRGCPGEPFYYLDSIDPKEDASVHNMITKLCRLISNSGN